MIRRYRDTFGNNLAVATIEDGNKFYIDFMTEIWDGNRWVRQEIVLDDAQISDLRETLRRMCSNYKDGDNLIMGPSYKIKGKKKKDDKEEKGKDIVGKIGDRVIDALGGKTGASS